MKIFPCKHKTLLRCASSHDKRQKTTTTKQNRPKKKKKRHIFSSSNQQNNSVHWSKNKRSFQLYLDNYKPVRHVHGTNQYGLWPSLFFYQDILHWAYHINMVTTIKRILQMFAKREAQYKEFRCKPLEIGFVEKLLFPYLKVKRKKTIPLKP